MDVVEMIHNLIENVKTMGVEKVFKRYYSVYRAQVMSNTDAEKRGRIEVQVPQLFGQKTLPTLAEPKDFRNTAKGRGEFFPPEVGDWVFVEFEGGDQRFPVYSGGWLAKGDIASIFVHDGKNKPVGRGYIDKFGNYWLFDQTEGKEQVQICNKDNIMTMDRDGIKVTDKNQNIVTMNADGIKVEDKNKNVVTMKAGEINIHAEGNLVLDTTGDVKATVGGNFQADVSGNAQVKADGNASFEGTGATSVGSGASVTQVKGSVVQLAGGGPPIARLGDMAIGVGNLGAPVISNIAQGSPKVTSG